MKWKSVIALGVTAMLLLAAPTPAQDAEHGRKALLTRAFTPAAWSLGSYSQAWKQWQPPLQEQPANYAQVFMDYYGLHTAPFDNVYPMGLRSGSRFIGKGITNDCMVCHGGSILGKSYVGLGNSALDIQALFNDLGQGRAACGKTPFIFSNVRGTSEAGSMAVFLLSSASPI